MFESQGVKLKGVLDRKFSSLEQAREFLEQSIGASYKVADIERKDAVRHPAPPFTTSTLQQEASRKLRLSVSATMRLAQGLYERGLITYMRTDSTNLSSLALGTSKEFIVNNFGAEYSHPRQFHTKAKGAQEAHEAIRPTYISNTDIDGTPQEKKLYNLIWKRTVASQMEDARMLNTTVKLSSDKREECFTIQAAQVLFDGFLKLYLEGSDETAEDEGNDAILPQIAIGDSFNCLSINADGKFTQPPYRYSEATLVKKLEELGIGRPSTYAPTITTLTTSRGYVAKGDFEGRSESVENLTLKNGKISSRTKTESIGSEKGKLLPQEIGIIVSDYLVENFPKIMDYDFTANVEKDFDSIAEGEKVWNSVISEFYTPFHGKVEATLEDKQYSRKERLLGVDPADGLEVYAKYGQFGSYVTKGEGGNKVSASLGKGQLIENITLEQALSLFQLPRQLGEMDGQALSIHKGRYGAYIKLGDRNISLPKGYDPLTVSAEQVHQIVSESGEKAQKEIINEFKQSDIAIINGRYGPYIKHAGQNYKIPKGKDAVSLSEQDCLDIIAQGAPTGRSSRFGKKK